ncbi:MAG TPA: hypothetical protein VK524_15060 [Polyangiaceae bacterium]|nr:hypothetical protein [Polyangiaceae bacterium]
MNPGRCCFVLLTLCLGMGLGVGCGDDEDEGGGGRAGSAGRGGAAGRGGGAGNAGASGTSGTSGAGGSNAGSGGTAGDASAGSGGSPGDASSEASDAGTQLEQCVDRCSAHEDCRVPNGDSPIDIGLRCSEQGRCGSSSQPRCTQASDCYPIVSPWSVECDSSSNPCLAGMACVDIGQPLGRCAPLKADGGCPQIFPDVISMVALGDAGSVEVCGRSTNVVCDDDGSCYTRECSTNTDCPLNKSFCIVESGKCGCANDGQCGPALGGAKCNLTTRGCGCVTNSDCAGVTNADRCVDGVCGCSGNAACTVPTFSGTTLACE